MYPRIYAFTGCVHLLVSKRRTELHLNARFPVLPCSRVFSLISFLSASSARSSLCYLPYLTYLVGSMWYLTRDRPSLASTLEG